MLCSLDVQTQRSLSSAAAVWRLMSKVARMPSERVVCVVLRDFLKILIEVNFEDKRLDTVG